ncbi:MAG: hypothetical protein Q9218_003680 [Villophora microphyllina]
MAEAIGITASIITLIELLAKSGESLLHFSQTHDDLKRANLELSLALQKFAAWQENWPSRVDNGDLSANTLWGTQGWATIHALLENIVVLGKKTDQLLREAQESLESKPRLRWKRAVDRIGRKGRANQRQTLRELAATLNKAVDELWICTETVFDSRHGLLAAKLHTNVREIFLDSVLQSRAGSMKLYTLCLTQVEDYSLEVDRLGNGSANNTFPLSYSLVTEPGEKELQRWVVKDVEVVHDSSIDAADDVDLSDLHLFRSKSGAKTVRVPQYHKSATCHLLQIPQAPSEEHHLRSAPETLEDVMRNSGKETKRYDWASSRSHFGTEAKIRLAFNIVECGIFLLGTPWFSSLNIRNLRRWNNYVNTSSSFILRIQTLDLKDLVSDDLGALAETTQLFRLGILLMEIALGAPDTDSQSADLEHDPQKISKLPLVERAMGAQYCKATAFCLQYRTRPFPGPEKYEPKHYAEWETYLAGFLRDYFSQVFLRQAVAFSPAQALLTVFQAARTQPSGSSCRCYGHVSANDA